MNIGDVTDVHYRYKMPVPSIKVEGRGNGIRTLVLNMRDIAKALNVSPKYITKYFGSEKGAQSKYDADGHAVINGQFDNTSVKQIFSDFIKKFVLCSKCHYPETTINVGKNDTVYLQCKACGQQTVIDPREKLYSFILKNPPPQLQSVTVSTTTSATGTTSEVGQQMASGVTSTGTSGDSGLNSESAAEKTITTTTAADIAISSLTQLQPKQQNSIQIQQQPQYYDEGTVEWSLDVSDEAVRKRREEEGLSEKIKNLTIVQDLEDEALVNPVDIMKEFLSKKQHVTEQQLLRASLKLKKDYDLRDTEMVHLLFQSLFQDKVNIVSLIKKRGRVLQRFIKNPAQQKIILAYIEELICLKEEELLKSTSIILEALYDAELVDDETVLNEWFESKKGKYLKDPTAIEKVRIAAKPFMTWLKTASYVDDDEVPVASGAKASNSTNSNVPQTDQQQQQQTTEVN